MPVINLNKITFATQRGNRLPQARDEVVDNYLGVIKI